MENAVRVFITNLTRCSETIGEDDLAVENPEAKRSLVDDIVSEPVVMSVILLNAIVAIYLYLYPQDQLIDGHWISWVDNACISFFVLEVVLKLRRDGARDYFASHWNKFDCVVTLASVPIMIAPLLGVPGDWFARIAIIRIIRLLRLLRALRITAIASLVHHAKSPVFAMIVFVLLYEFVGAIDVAHEAKDWVLDGLKVAMIVATAWLLERLYVAFDDIILTPRAKSGVLSLDPTLLVLVRIVVRLAIYFGGMVVALDTLGQDPFHLIAGLGIGGMAIAFAARDFVANLIAGVLVFMNRPFRVGERISVAGTDGWVAGIGLRETIVTNFYGQRIHVPNKTFMEQNIQNVDSRQSYLTHVPLKLHHQTTSDGVSQALRILNDIAAEDGLVLETIWTHFEAIDQDGLRVSLWYYIERWRPEERATIGGEFHKIYTVQSRINLEIMKRFEAAGIRLALPVRVNQVVEEGSGTLYGRPPQAPNIVDAAAS